MLNQCNSTVAFTWRLAETNFIITDNAFTIQNCSHDNVEVLTLATSHEQPQSDVKLHSRRNLTLSRKFVVINGTCLSR